MILDSIPNTKKKKKNHNEGREETKNEKKKGRDICRANRIP